MAAAPWLPPHLWESTVRYTVNRKNITGTTDHPEVIPLQLYFHDILIDITRFRQFGTPCFYMLSPQSLEELEELQRILRQKDRRSKHEKKLFSTQKMMDEMLLQVSASEAQLRGSLQQSPPVATSASDPLPPTPADWPEALSGLNAKEWTAAREGESRYR